MLYQLLKSRYILFYCLICLVCIVVNSGWWILQEVAFFDVTKTGELLSRLSEDTQIIKNAATTNLSEALRNVSTALIGLGFMFATSWKLTCKHLIIGLAVNEPHFSMSPWCSSCAFFYSFTFSVVFGCCTGYFCCCTSIWPLPSWTFSQDSSCCCCFCFNCWGILLPTKFRFSVVEHRELMRDNIILWSIFLQMIVWRIFTRLTS